MAKAKRKSAKKPAKKRPSKKRSKVSNARRKTLAMRARAAVAGAARPIVGKATLTLNGLGAAASKKIARAMGA